MSWSSLEILRDHDDLDDVWSHYNLLTFLVYALTSRVSAEAESLNEKFGTKGVKVQSGDGGLTKVVLSTSNGRFSACY